MESLAVSELYREWELWDACYDGDDDVVKNILEGGMVDLRLYTANEFGGATALHMACAFKRPSIIPLLAKHRSCTSAVLNKRDEDGYTPLMLAVFFHDLESVEELGKLEGINFRTVNNVGETLLDVARLSLYYVNDDDDEVVKYLLEKQKRETLEEKAAYHVAAHISNVEDVEKLEIPLTLFSLVQKFLEF